jgi:spore germination protein
MGQNRLSNKSIHHKEDEYIFSPSQVMSLITSTIIGVGVLTLPRTVTETAHQSGWLSTLAGGLVGIIVLMFIFVLGKRFVGEDIFSISQEVLGGKKHKIIGRILSFPVTLAFVVFWITTTAGTARTFGEVVVTAVLVRTPLEIIVGSMLFVSYIMVMYDVEVMARVNEVLLPIIIIPVLLISLLAFQSAHFSRLLPLISVDWKEILKGTLFGSFSYLGYETVGLYIGNMDTSTKKTMKAMIYGVAIPMLVYTLIVIAGIAAFGYEELSRLMWPTLELVKTTEVPGLILERLESAFLGVWVAAVFTTTANLYFSISFAIKKLFKLHNHRYIALGVLPVLYVMAMWPKNVTELFNYLHNIAYIGLALGFISPLSLLLIALIRKKGQWSSPGGNKS